MVQGLTKEEVNRKLLHGVAVVLPVGIFYGPALLGVSEERVCFGVFVLLAAALLIELLRFRNQAFLNRFMKWFGSMMRESELRQLTGATYVLAGSGICSLISLRGESAAAACFLGLTLFILGDAAAALVGKAFGRMKIGGKTVEGALGCFLLCMALACWVFPSLPDFLAKWGTPFTLLQMLVIATSVSLLELFPIRIGRMVLNDNLYVPALVSLLGLMIR
ncbi:MAG: hypothetical protein CMI22_09645 [Opitutae bacterium]|nr:hypothetical protein [Opitutae bacterium]